MRRPSYRSILRKRAAFVEQLASHSEAGRMHAQDASFIHPPTRSQSQPTLVDSTLDPHALLTLPEFIREGIPAAVQQHMHFKWDPETVLSLTEFIKEHPVPDHVSPTPPSRRQSINQSASNTRDEDVVASAVSRRVSKGNRARSMSEPLSWLLSSRSSSPGSSLGLKRHSSRKSVRPSSSHGTPPDVEGM